MEVGLEAAAYALFGIGGLLLGFPYVPFMKGDAGIQHIEGDIRPAAFAAVAFWFGAILFFVGSVANLVGFEVDHTSTLHPFALKMLVTGLLFLLIAGFWRLVTAMANLYQAGSRSLPFQLLGVILILIGITLGTIHLMTKDCAC